MITNLNPLLRGLLSVLCILLFSLEAQAKKKNNLSDFSQPSVQVSAIDDSKNDDDFVIIEEGIGEDTTDATTQNSQSFNIKSYYDEHFSSLVTGSYAGFTGKTTRDFYYFQTRYREEFKELGLSGVFELRAYRSSNKIKFEKSTVGLDGKETRQDLTLKISDKSLQIREAYIRLSRPTFDLYAGKKIVTFGQFNAFSPVDFLLPVDYGNSVLTFSKVDNKFPQTVLSATLYPIKNWELELYYFPKIERDYTVVKTFEKSKSGFTSNGKQKTIPFGKPSNESQKAARLLYVGQNLTLGFTYYKGFSIIPESFDKLKNNHFEPTKSTYRDLTGYGFEASYAYNDVNFKYEVASINYFNQLGGCNTNADIITSVCKEYRTHIKNNLGGNAYIEPRVEIHAVGFDYDSENWIINVALLGAFYRLSSTDKKAEELRKKEVGSSTNRHKRIIFPTFNLAKKYGIDKKYTTGFGFGFLSSALGASLYHNYKYSEDLFFTGAVEYLRYQNDEAARDQLSQENKNSNIELKSDSVLLRIGIAYQF